MSTIDILKRISGQKYYVNLPAALINILIQDIGRTSAMTWLYLYEKSYWNEGIIGISFTDLAKELGCSRRSLIYETNNLISKNYLKKIKKSNGYNKNIYEICLPNTHINTLKNSSYRPKNKNSNSVDKNKENGAKYALYWCKNYTVIPDHSYYKINNNIKYNRESCLNFDQFCEYPNMEFEYSWESDFLIEIRHSSVNQKENMGSNPTPDNKQRSEEIRGPLRKEIEEFIDSMGNKINRSELLSEALYAISHRFTKNTHRHAFNTFKKLIREGRWTTPYAIRKNYHK